MLAPWKKSYDKLRQCIKKQGHHFANKGPYSQSYGFSSSHVWMWELDYKESWAANNRCFWTVVLEKTPESPLNSKEIQSVHPKGNQPWIFWKDRCWSWSSNTLTTCCEELTRLKELTHLKRPWCWERLREGGGGDNRGRDGWWHHRLDGQVYEQTPGDTEGPGSLACCSPRGPRAPDTTERLNSNDWQELKHLYDISPSHSHELIYKTPILNSDLGPMWIRINSK